MLKPALLGAAFVVGACGGPPGGDGRSDGSASVNWSERAPIGGGPRLEGAIVALGDLIYVIGGWNSGSHITGDVAVYDPASDAWTEAAPLPRALHHLNAVAAGDRIYIVGALHGTSFAPVGEVSIYDPAADAWSSGAPMPGGTERGASAVAVLGDDILVAGGSRDDAVDTVSAYSTVDDAWSERAPMPAPNYHAVGAAVDGLFYAVGGLSAGLLDGTSRPVRDLLVYDPATDGWSARADMPTARGGCAAGVIANRILCAGGEAEPSNNGGIATETESYDVTTGDWSTLEPMRTARGGTGGAVVGGLLYVPGGAEILAFRPVTTNEVYTPPE